VASSGNLNFSFMIVGWRKKPGVEVNTNDLVHVQLQTHLYEPPGAIDTCYLLASVHLGDSLMKHVVYTAQEVFSKGDALIAANCVAITIWFRVGSLALP
jgi:hypothetical protein